MLEGIVAYKLEGNEEQADMSIQHLIRKHPELNLFKIKESGHFMNNREGRV